MFDLQVNGFKTETFSCNFWQKPDQQSILELCKFEFTQGVEKFLATLITDSFENLEKNLENIQDYLKQDKHLQAADIVGVHIEGALISRFGVHPEKYAREMNLKKAQELVKKFPGLIKLWTLCPALDTRAEISKFLQSEGIVVSYGHSNASYEEAMEAFEESGVRLVTHWGNAMKIWKGFKQRNTEKEDLEKLEKAEAQDLEEPGIGLAAYRHPDVICMAICGSKKYHDEHLDPLLFQQLATKKKNKLILVSDSVACDPQPGYLQGGLSSLQIHYTNAKHLGLNDLEIIHATKTLPDLVLSR